jgi:two-component system response regulator FlrC
MPNKPTILLSEPDAGLQEALKLLLEDWATVSIVPTLEAGLQLLTEAPTDLFILDVDGQSIAPLSFLTVLRVGHPNLKILLVAGQFDFDFQVAALKFPPVSFLTKPFEPQVAVEKMQTLTGYAKSSIRTRVLRLPIQ